MAGLKVGRRVPPAQPPVRILNPADPRFRTALRKTIIGSAMMVEEDGDVDELKRVAQPWQLEALGFRSKLGEVRYASDFYARPLRRLRFYVAEIQEDGTLKPTDNVIAQQTLARIRDPGGGTQGLVTQYGRLMFCTGEALLLYTPASSDYDDTTDVGEAEKWEMLSTAELRKIDGAFLRYTIGGGSGSSGGERLPEDSVVYRLWQRDPMYSELADAPMRAILDLCEELMILTLVVRARAISRLAGNGILFVPNDITLTPAANQTVGDEDMREDPFFEELIKTLLAPIEDLSSASAAVPLLVRGPAEAGAAITHISVRDPQETFPENALREQTIHRMALSLDMPPEALTGIADANHWSAWQVEREAWRHAEPVARQFCDDMTVAYLRGALLEEGVPVGDIDRYVIAYDASEILTNPDRGTDAKDAFSIGAIGYEGYREAMGWNDDDAPKNQEEIDLMLQFLGRSASGAVEDVPEAEGEEPVEDETGPPASDPNADGLPTDGTPGETASLIPRLLGAAEMAVLRHREVAGAKIRTKANGCDPCKDRIDGVPNGQVAAMLGFQDCADLGVGDPLKLVSGREQLMAMTSTRAGLDQGLSSALAQLVEHHAARTLFDLNPAPFPPSAITAVLGRR